MISERTITDRIQKRMAKLYLARIYKALQSQVKAFNNNLEQYGLTYAKAKLTTTVLNVPMSILVRQIYVAAAISNANRIYSRLRKYERRELKYRTFGFNEKWTAEVLRYFELHLLEKAVIPISEETTKIILAIVKKGTEEGWGIEEMVRQITEKTTEINRMRARKIVRTETVRGTSFGGMVGAWESPYVTEKGWSSAHDNRVRGRKPKDKHSHIGLNDQWVDLLEPFYDPISGEAIMFPGDPEASAGNTINCRCANKFRPKKDAQGRLIRKDQNSPIYQNSLVDALAGAKTILTNG